ncbi:MAG: hypothetical protein JW725_04880, partial [Candidatus Babeliaceae bacterium]|nr:hypothetical protein [Candidatus Babeliaceae bacterium]
MSVNGFVKPHPVCRVTAQIVIPLVLSGVKRSRTDTSGSEGNICVRNPFDYVPVGLHAGRTVSGICV